MISQSYLRSNELNNLEAECLRKRVDAKIQKKSIDELLYFESDKKLLNDILFKAELLLESKLWSDALSEFTVYVNKASDLLLRKKGIEEAKAAVAKIEALMPKHGDVKTVLLPGNVPLEMVYVAPGSFDMGSPIEENDRYDDELLHRVNLTRGFWLGKYPVTQRQWECVMGYNLSYFKGFDKPVEMVSWNDCQKFIAKCNQELQKEFGGEVRLPTEAEWEYACRAGSRGAYGGTGKLDDMGWYDNTFFGFGLKTKEVGLKSSNAWGFYDMHGNVWEWCQDWYGAYSTEGVTNPIGPASGDRRVLRGGSWNDGAWNCRSAIRVRCVPGARFHYCGFRLACSVLP
jgi:formylglycine-generating enzyme required for sulfatase activity